MWNFVLQETGADGQLPPVAADERARRPLGELKERWWTMQPCVNNFQQPPSHDLERTPVSEERRRSAPRRRASLLSSPGAADA